MAVLGLRLPRGADCSRSLGDRQVRACKGKGKGKGGVHCSKTPLSVPGEQGSCRRAGLSRERGLGLIWAGNGFCFGQANVQVLEIYEK